MSVIGSDESMDELEELDAPQIGTVEEVSSAANSGKLQTAIEDSVGVGQDEDSNTQPEFGGSGPLGEVVDAVGDPEASEFETKSAGMQDCGRSSACAEDKTCSLTTLSEKGDCKMIPEGINIPSMYLHRAQRFEALISGVNRSIRKKSMYEFREDLIGTKTKMLLEGDFTDSNWISLLTQAVYEECKRANKRITKRLARNKKLKFK